MNFLLRCNYYVDFTLINKELLLSCIATSRAQKEVPMIGIAIVFLVSTVVLMALSAIEG